MDFCSEGAGIRVVLGTLMKRIHTQSHQAGKSQLQWLSPLSSGFKVLEGDPLNLVVCLPLCRGSKDTLTSTFDREAHRAGEVIYQKGPYSAIKRQGE